jgi:hypothetical protein
MGESMTGKPLSGRARTKLLRYQQSISTQSQALRTSDRILAGTLAACDAATQCDVLAAHLEYVQELRVSLHRLDAFLGSHFDRFDAAREGALGATGGATAD